MSAAATAIASWVAETPVIDGVLFGSSDGEVDGPPVCAVAVAGKLRGYGKGVTQSQALASAVGEVLELFAASQVDAQRLVYCAFAEIAERAFDPRWLGLYTAEQYQRPGFSFWPFDPQAPLHWVKGRWLDTAEPVYLPAFAVYLCDQFAGEALAQMSSNGLGAGESLEAAIEHAVLELYERDAFLLSWMALLPKNKLAAVDDTAGILAHLEARGAETEVYLLAQTPAFVAAAVATGDGVRWPAVTLGLGAARHAKDAVAKAILELGQTAPYLARVWRRGEVTLPATPQDVRTLRDHALYYCAEQHRPEFERWRNTPPGSPFLRSAEVRIAFADLTPPALADSPYRVVRALGCGLQPLHSRCGLERLACERLAGLLADAPVNTAPCPIL
jgi:ribosomal protein S12 methylthiotransferase accessory factor